MYFFELKCTNVVNYTHNNTPYIIDDYLDGVSTKAFEVKLI